MARNSVITSPPALLSMCFLGLLALFLATSSKSIRASNGVQHYLPVTMATEIEARIEKLFVLANIPIIKRPIPINAVREAIYQTSHKYPALSRSVSRYLERYEKSIGITHFSASLRTSDDTDQKRINSRGESVSSNYAVTQRSFISLGDHVIFNSGNYLYEGQGSEKDRFSDGTFLSLGWDVFQADIGYRSHWLGPFSDSDMLSSTNAPALPSITLSNSRPLFSFNMQYEVFLAEMSESDGIQSDEDESVRLTGSPKLFGIHLSFIPLDGFAIGFNRLLQFGGADRDSSVKSLAEAFFQAKQSDNSGAEGNDFGNQLSSVTTRYTFSDRLPLSVYMEYAGEDTSFSSDFHLGNSSILLGFYLPTLTETLELTYEYADWQNAWYTNNNYSDGLNNYNSILGHWAAEQREFGDAVPATSQMAKLLWQVGNGKTLKTIIRTVENKPFTPRSGEPYERSTTMEIEYSQSYKEAIVGLNLFIGNTVFDKNFSQLSAFIRW